MTNSGNVGMPNLHVKQHATIGAGQAAVALPRTIKYVVQYTILIA